jgi:hypothetical protein
MQAPPAFNPPQVTSAHASPFEAGGAAAPPPAASDAASSDGERGEEAVFDALETGPGALTVAHSVNVAPSTLEWQGIGCSYNTPTGPKEVLADIWGIAQPGEMQALLGPSG